MAVYGALVTVTLVIGAVFAGALTRATFGFGEAVVSMPILALLPVSLHTSASLIGLAGLTVAALSLAGRSREIGSIDRSALLRLCVGTVLGVPLGIAVLRLVPRTVTSIVLGGSLVIYAAYSLAPSTTKRRIGVAWAYPTGFAAGAPGSAYNFNGVPVVVFGSLRRWPPAAFRGTLQAR